MAYVDHTYRSSVRKWAEQKLKEQNKRNGINPNHILPHIAFVTGSCQWTVANAHPFRLHPNSSELFGTHQPKPAISTTSERAYIGSIARHHSTISVDMLSISDRFQPIVLVIIIGAMALALAEEKQLVSVGKKCFFFFLFFLFFIFLQRPIPCWKRPIYL